MILKRIRNSKILRCFVLSNENDGKKEQSKKGQFRLPVLKEKITGIEIDKETLFDKSDPTNQYGSYNQSQSDRDICRAQIQRLDSNKYLVPIKREILVGKGGMLRQNVQLKCEDGCEIYETID